jgi:hypothetical protein
MQMTWTHIIFIISNHPANKQTKKLDAWHGIVEQPEIVRREWKI